MTAMPCNKVTTATRRGWRRPAASPLSEECTVISYGPFVSELKRIDRLID